LPVSDDEVEAPGERWVDVQCAFGRATQVHPAQLLFPDGKYLSAGALDFLLEEVVAAGRSLLVAPAAALEDLEAGGSPATKLLAAVERWRALPTQPAEPVEVVAAPFCRRHHWVTVVWRRCTGAVIVYDSLPGYFKSADYSAAAAPFGTLVSAAFPGERVASDDAAVREHPQLFQSNNCGLHVHRRALQLQSGEFGAAWSAGTPAESSWRALARRQALLRGVVAGPAAER
jgi:hypothetical protein